MSSLEARSAERLGPELLRCRRRSQKDCFVAQGNNAIWFYLRNLSAAGIGAVFIVGGIGEAVRPRIPPQERHLWLWAMGTVFLILSILFFWLAHREPRKSQLILHEHGFHWKRRFFHFNDLAELRTGHPKSAIIAGVQGLASITGHAEVGRSFRSSLTITENNGRVSFLRDILAGTEPRDLRRVLAELFLKRPDLKESADLMAGLQKMRIW